MLESLDKALGKTHRNLPTSFRNVKRTNSRISKHPEKPPTTSSAARQWFLGFFPVLIVLGLQFFLPAPAASEPPTEIKGPLDDPIGRHPTQMLQAGPHEYPVSFNWNLTQASKYLFQGIDYSNGHPVIQPLIGFGYKGVTFTSWFNFDEQEHRFDEVDLLLQTSWTLGSLSLAPGYAYYNYPNREGWDPSQEIYMDISYDTFLNPTFSPHYDVDRGQGAYYTLGLSHDFQTALGSFGLGTKLFYQSKYYDVTGFPSTQFSAKYVYSKDSWTVSPSISYFLTWSNGDFRDDARVPETWLFSLDIGQSF